MLPRAPAARLAAPTFGALLAAFALAAPALAASSPPSTPVSAADTKLEFQRLCNAFRQGDDPFFGNALARRLRGLLEQPAQDPAVRVGRRARLGVELLRLGDNAEAVALLEEASRMADETGQPGELRRQVRRDLALAYLRLAEAKNCVEHHAAASCIVPLLPEAVHSDPRPARRAAELYEELLAETPGKPALQWLHAVADATAGGADPVPWAVPANPAAQMARWPQVGMAVGLHRRDLAGGAAMDDFDGDGDLDLISSTNDPCGSMTALRNDMGSDAGAGLSRGTFVDVTEAWGLDAQWGGLNFVHADVDGDGDLDLFVLRGGWWRDHGELRNSLLRNDLSDGGGFVDITRAAGLAEPAAPTQTAAFADLDGDGDLDLYVGYEANRTKLYTSRLYLNTSIGNEVRFEDVTERAGVANLRYAKGVTWGDVDDDGDPDLYVSNLVSDNRLYRNDSTPEEPSFVDVAAEAGVTEPLTSFATWFFDADNDGDLDLFVADYSARYYAVQASLLGATVADGNPRLFLNDHGHFEDVSRAWGLTRPALVMGANFGDIDGDGYSDIYLGTGTPDYEALMPNVMLRNTGGHGFVDVTYAGGFGHLQKGHGVAFGDLDGDGDQDIFHQLGGQYPGDGYANALFENPGEGDPGYVTLRFAGAGANRFAIGARFEVILHDKEGSRSVFGLVGTGGSFGGNSLQQEVGLGAAADLVTVAVRWPGTAVRCVFQGLRRDLTYRLVEGERRIQRAESAAGKLPGR